MDDGFYEHVREVGFLEAIKLGFQNYFRFSGRAQRAEYWWFYLFTIIASIVLTIFDVVVLDVDEPSEDFSPAADLFSLAVLIPTLSLGWRRMHDIGKSGWWTFLWLAPLIWTGVAAFIFFESSEEMTTVGVIAIILGVITVLASLVYVIVLLATDSEPRDNRYGPSVKYVGPIGRNQVEL